MSAGYINKGLYIGVLGVSQRQLSCCLTCDLTACSRREIFLKRHKGLFSFLFPWGHSMVNRSSSVQLFRLFLSSSVLSDALMFSAKRESVNEQKTRAQLGFPQFLLSDRLMLVPRPALFICIVLIYFFDHPKGWQLCFVMLQLWGYYRHCVKLSSRNFFI